MEEMFLRFLEYCVTEEGGAYILVSAILLVVLLIFAILRVLLTPFRDKLEKLFEEDEEQFYSKLGQASINSLLGLTR